MRPSLTRREFFRQSARAAAALSSVRLGLSPGEPGLSLTSGWWDGDAPNGPEAPARPATLERPDALKKFIIIGAGLAGLAAAFELAQAGHDVVVLEAEMRPGGRVQTIREPFSDGLYAEAGAGRIPDVHHWTLNYVKLFELMLDPFWPSEGFYVNYLRGRRYSVRPGESMDLSDVPLELTPEERRLGLAGIDKKYVVPFLDRLGRLDAPDWPPSALRKYDQMTWIEFLRQQGASPGAIALLELGGAFETDSALDYLRDDFSHHAKQLFKIRGGNDLLPKAFAARLADRIHYGSPVVRIERLERSVRVTSLQAGVPQSMEASRVVSAVPATVLRRIEVLPPFSPGKQEALAQLAYDAVVRVFFQTRKRYWKGEGFNGFAMTDSSTEIWQPTFDQPGPRGILVAYLLDVMGRRVTDMPASERASFMLEEVGKVFPGLRENLEGSFVKTWEEDPWARGAYAVFKPGQVTSLRARLQAPEGRVHFAGEHISSWPGWMQGALESGIRAAREVQEAD